MTGAARAAWSQVLSARHHLPGKADRLLERAKWLAVGRPAGLKPAPKPQGQPPRVLIAPANAAGQGTAWAGALSRHGLASGDNWAFEVTKVFDFEATYRAPFAINAASIAFQRHQFDQVRRSYQAVLLESGLPLFGRLFGYDPAGEATALATAGLAVAVMWHGSDVRLPLAHAASHRLSPYGLPSFKRRAAELESTARRNRRNLLTSRWPQLVSTPDLLDSVPGASWCPVVVDLPEASNTEPLVRDVPKVVHIPSNPVVKGTDLVEPVFRQLAAAGQIEYIQAAGLPAAEVLELYGRADIVADQFRLGIYGVAACEVMARGGLVISDVDDQVRQRVKAETGLDLPIWQVEAANLASGIGQILAQRDQARRLATQGRAFVQAIHDGRRSAAVMARTLGLGGDSDAVADGA
ncbi:MAG: hypothetical protein FWD29_02745 [Micrococcales bacterium]|nr:hypothetical protein [Micrococcales bacterium]